ncbi:S-layer homology domain-containing protein [Paenibacillus sp. FSL L8-0436]|uniref:S-layer homology domain-containing protein n=1 Tax=Paenibacillus sp. FSL L8-0436 TaxID=2954686 RepID=UPI0031580DEC
MKIVKKGFALLLVIFFTISPYASVFAGTASDISGNWAEPQISKWMEKGFISGYPDGRFKPVNPITRAELVSLVNKSFGFVESKSVEFKDVAASSWVYPELLKANAAGYISGYGNGSFGPGNKVTRQELAVIVSKLLGLTASADANFSDTADSPAWCKDAISAVQEKGIRD